MSALGRFVRGVCALLPLCILGSLLGAVPAHASGGPSISISTPTADGTNGWYKAQPTLTLSASDSAGISSVSWSWSGASSGSGSTPYSSPYPTTASATTQPTTPGTSTLTATVTEVGGATASATATVKWDPDAPSQPTNPHWYNLVDQSSSTSANTTSSQPIASWGTSTDATSGVNGYRVQISETTDFSQPLAQHEVSGATSWYSYFGQSDGMVPGHSYYFRVAAIDLAGNLTWSAVSNRLDYSTEQTGPALFHAPVTTGFVGQSIPISLQATCGSGHNCAGRLYYRPTPLTGINAPLSGGWTRAALTQGTAVTVNGKSALTWTGSIPGTAVSTSGVDYFVEAEDNFALTQLPGMTYLDSDSYGGAQPAAHSFFHVQVVAPPLLVHQPQPYAQSGAPIPLSLQATCSTGSCTATLYYRTSTDGALSQPLYTTPAWPRVQMQADANPTVLPQGAGQVMTFRAQIPASYVDTQGVDYFFSVSDGATTSWWPGSPPQGYYAPTDGMRTGYQHVHVLETPHVTHVPVTQSPYRTDIPVDAQASCSSLTCSGTLYFRTTTTSITDTTAPFASAPMTVSQVTNQNGNAVIALHGVIPAAVADTRGVDYFFSVSDGATTSWWPGTSSTDGYVPVPGAQVGYQHVRVLEAPHFYDVPPATAPALQNLTISAPVTCATESCTVTLYYAGSTTALNGPFTAVPMTKASADTATPIGTLATWSGTIPAAQVTTRGVAYYLKAFDGYVNSYSPGTSYWGAYVPVDGTQVGVHPVRVLEPPHVVHAPVATAYYGQPIAIMARSNCATAACTATLEWNDLAGHQHSATMTAAPPVQGTPVGALWTFDGTIPGTDVTTRGVHYDISINDGYVSDTTPTYQTTVLAPTAILHAPVLSATPGAPIPIDAVVPCSTNTCSVTVSYRTTGSGLLAEPAWQTVNMTLAPPAVAVGQATAVGHYVAQIPASVVTTAGVDYYIKADDGSTQAYSPGTTWVATPVAWSQGARTYYFHVHVAEPIHYTHAPVTVAPAGDPIHIVAQANCSSANCAGTLSYRTTSGLMSVSGLENYLAGLPAFTSTPMSVRVVQDLGGGGKLLEFSADIPASVVTTDGVDYSFHLTDGATNAYFPGTSYIGGLGSADGIQTAWQHVVVTAQHATGSIGDHVYLDPNNNGTQDSGEPGLAGVTVNLTGAGLDGTLGTTDDTHASQVTDQTGFYDFTGLLPGTYRVDVDPATAPSGTIPTTAVSHTSNLGPTQADYTADFGFRYDGTAGGTVFTDANVNHTFDSGEAGVAGVRVNLTAPGSDGAFGTSDDVHYPTQTTDSNGAFLFNGLAPGTYQADVDPSSFPAGTASTSSHPLTITVAPHQAVSGVNFGIGYLPGAPTAVTATGGNASATVTWTAPASTGSGPLTSYTVTASPGGATKTVAASTTTATVTGLANGTAYTFRVTATNGVGTGPASASSNSVTPATVPDPPTNVSATPGNAQATVSWTAPAWNGGSAITSYTVTANPGGATATVNAPATTATVTGLTNGTSYTFTVKATNAVGTGAASASSNAVVPFAPPGAPTNVAATPADRSANVTWTAAAPNGSPITSYTVTANPGGATSTVNAPATSATVTGLTNGTAYTFTVVATNAAGPGPASAPSAPVTPRTTPGAPTNVAATAGSSSATVTWTAPADNGGAAVVSYTVTASTGGASATVNAPATTATVTGLTPGTSYTFVVTATNAAGAGVASSSSNAVVPYTMPGAPTGVTAAAGNASAQVSWSPPTSDGYSGITAYTITASPGGATQTVGSMTTSWTFSGLTNGTTYTFTVAATNAAGTGASSLPSNAVTPAPQLPSAPTGVSATPGTASALVTWTAAAANGSPVTGYLVTSSPGGKTASTSGTATSVAVGGLANGTAYTFTVRATNGVGTGPASAPTQATTPAATAPPYAARGLANVASVDTFGQQGNSDAWAPSVSSDGRYIAFVSRAGNWLANPHGYAEIWVRDLVAGTTTLASANTAGAPASGDSTWPTISANGRYVAFASTAADLVAGDTNSHQDIFRRDLQAGTILVSVAPDGSGANGDSITPSISANGNRIAFTSSASNLVASDRNGSDQDVFVRDVPSNATVLADGTGFSGYINDGFGYSPQAALARNGRQAISADGNYVVYTGHNYGGALHSDRCSGSYDIPNAYLANLTTFATPTVQMVGPGDGIGCYDAGYGSADTVANNPSISGNGTVIAYIGTDRQLHYFSPTGPGTVTIPLTIDGSSPNQPVDDPWLNTDGRRAMYSTTSSNIVPGDGNGREDAFYVDFSAVVRPRLLSATASGGFPASFSNSNGSNWPAVSLDGTKGAFASGASDLAANDLNGANDVFLFNLPQPAGGPFSPGELLAGGHNCAENCLGGQISGLTNRTLWPVDTATGNFWHTFDDLTIAGRGPAIHLSHTYNSMAAATDGPLGYGWTESYNFALTNPDNSPLGSSPTAVIVHQENGAQASFQQDASGAWVAPARVDATLVHNGNGTWTFTRRARQIFSFDASGNLTAERDLNGYVTTVGPRGSTQTITDPAGRTLTLTYSGSHITRATDSASPARSVSFAYDGTWNLTDVTDVNGGVTHFTYDANHRLLTMTPPNQHGQANPAVIANAYDTAGRVTSQTDPVGRITAFDYTSIPGSTKVTDSMGNVSVYTYVDGLLAVLTNGYGTPKSATTSFTYDPVTLGITSVTDPNGHTTTMTYDAHGNVLSSTDPLGNVERRTYDVLEDMTSVQDRNLVTTTNTYDPNGNLLSTSTPLAGSPNRVTSLAYDTSHPGDVVSVTDPDLAVWHQIHDPATGYVTSVSDPMTSANTTTYCYDSIGRPTKVIGPRGTAAGVGCSSTSPALSLTVTAYDNAGDVTQVTDPLGHSTVRHYDADGNLQDETDARNHVTRYAYDADDELLSVTRPDNTVIGYGYDTGGNRTLYTDGATNATRWTFDDPALPHAPTATTDPGGKDYPNGRTTTVAYDRAGNRTSLTDPAGQVTTFGYDAGDRLTSTTYSDGHTPNVTNINYDADGQRTGMTDGTGTSAWAWDSLGRLTSSTNGAGQTVGYHYDLKGQLTTLDYPGLGSVTRNFDAAGRLTDITDWASHRSTFGYDGDSFLTGVQYANGTTATNTPDDADRLMGITYAKAGTTFASFSYGRNAVDSVNSVTSTGVPSDNHSYSYTALDQVQNVDSASTAYAYDAADNPTNLSNGTGQAFDDANQLCWTKSSAASGSCTSPPSGATTYGYDNRGNRTTVTPASGPATTLGYDQANRLTSYGTTATYAYDGDGVRASKTVSGSTTRFTWDEAHGLPQLLLDGSTAYVYGPDGLPLEQVSGSTVRYYHHDQLGSTRVITDSTGVAVGTWTYDAYGKVTGSTGSVSNPFGYAGQYTDAETGFQYLRARYYDPLTAQFLTRDPAVATTHSPYGYAGGNPVNGVDPSGLISKQDIANGAGGVLNGLTLGHEKTVTGWLGISDHVDRCSGAYAVGTQVGQGILLAAAGGAAGDLLEGASAVEAESSGASALEDAAESCSVNSFTAATPVLLADGREVPIAEIHIGDKVLATDPQTGQTTARPVTNVIVHTGKHTMVDVTLADGSKLTATDHHPFWDVTTGRFTFAVDLHVGDEVREVGGKLLAVSAIDVHDEDVTAYNLTVDGIHTYYAGMTPVLVHNSCWPSTPEEMDEILGQEGTRVPDGPSTPGRGKVTWDTSDGKITYEQHPYHPDAPEWHRGPHWHYDEPGGAPHQRAAPGDPWPSWWSGE